MGYRVVQVAEEKDPSPARAHPPVARVAKGPPPRKADPAGFWVPIIAGGCSAAVLLVALLVLIMTSGRAAAPQRQQVVWAPQPVQEVAPPAAPQVILPPAGAGPVNNNPNGPRPRGFVPGAPAVNLPEAALAPQKQQGLADARPGPAQDGGGLVGDPRPGCETFGTAVEFARNPVEAARIAAEQRKLTFLLHVSGNFEEARFT
jgi:hypothetical protein